MINRIKNRVYRIREVTKTNDTIFINNEPVFFSKHIPTFNSLYQDICSSKEVDVTTLTAKYPLAVLLLDDKKRGIPG